MLHIQKARRGYFSVIGPDHQSWTMTWKAHGWVVWPMCVTPCAPLLSMLGKSICMQISNKIKFCSRVRITHVKVWKNTLSLMVWYNFGLLETLVETCFFLVVFSIWLVSSITAFLHTYKIWWRFFQTGYVSKLIIMLTLIFAYVLRQHKNVTLSKHFVLQPGTLCVAASLEQSPVPLKADSHGPNCIMV
jgi:hypothetical protein